MTDAATRLAAAKAAYDLLVAGDKPEEFHDQSGERIVYSRGNPRALLALIRQLEAEVGSPNVLGPLRPIL